MIQQLHKTGKILNAVYDNEFLLQNGTKLLIKFQVYFKRFKKKSDFSFDIMATG